MDYLVILKDGTALLLSNVDTIEERGSMMLSTDRYYFKNKKYIVAILDIRDVKRIVKVGDRNGNSNQS